MKRNTWIAVSLIACSLAFSNAGCKKETAGPRTPEQVMLELQAALTKATPEVQNNFQNRVVQGIRYGKNADALAALEQMGNDASLNEQQKKLIKEESDLLRAKAGTQ